MTDSPEKEALDRITYERLEGSIGPHLNPILLRCSHKDDVAAMRQEVTAHRAQITKVREWLRLQVMPDNQRTSFAERLGWYESQADACESEILAIMAHESMIASVIELPRFITQATA